MQFCCCNLSPRGDGNHAKRNSIPLQPLQFIPARGRKLSSHSLFSFRIQVAIYPREGTETFFTENMYRLDGCGCNLYPRGDGSIKNYSKQHIRFGCNLSPRGDGNAKMVPLTIKQLKLQFIPARGRKQNGFCRAHGIRSCNLSPRGDGNSIRPRDVHGYAMLQFIPARGRKQRGDAAGGKRVRCNLSPRGDGNNFKIPHRITVVVAIYPREGTETHPSTSLVLSPSAGCNLSPRGDGNLFTSTRTFNPGLLQFIPARGRKRSRRPHRLHWPPLQFIPARGRKR